MSVILTSEYAKAPMARAVPGARYDDGAWVLDEPTPRASVVALKLFPGIEHDFPELLELRDSMIADVKPVDHATRLGLRIGSERVRAEMAKRNWSLARSTAPAVGVGEDFQEVDLGYAAAILREYGGFYLGWARGLGKTLGTAALIDELDCQYTLVVAPNTAKSSTWARELAWALPWAEVVVMPNAKPKREALLRWVKDHNGGTPLVLVTHYESLAIIAGKSKKEGKTSTQIGDGWKKLGITWDLVALDEGHRIANPKALQSRAARKIPSKARIVLSGSVMQNDWEELFGPLQFLYPKRYKSRWRDWNDRFLDYVENGYGRICVGVKEGQEEALRDELGVFMTIRDKEAKAQPATIMVDLSPSQRAAYDELVEHCLAVLEDGTRIKAQLGVAMLTRLRQVASGLDTLSRDLSDSTKLDATIALIQKLLPRGDDFVVFTWYKATAYALAHRLNDLGIRQFTVTGDVKHETRAEYIERFTAGEGRVFIGTIPTLGESVNLQRANHVIRIDRSFNPALNLQAVDRVDRQGQTRDVYLTDIVARDTVDELVVMPNLANKMAQRAAILGGQAV